LPDGGLAVVFVETKRAADSLELDLHDAGVRFMAIAASQNENPRCTHSKRVQILFWWRQMLLPAVWISQMLLW